MVGGKKERMRMDLDLEQGVQGARGDEGVGILSISPWAPGLKEGKS